MKVGGQRNYGFGKSLAWAGKNALHDRYGDGHFATQASHAARWTKFAAFAKREGVRDARAVTRDLVSEYTASLAEAVEARTLSVRYAQNLLSSVNVVLETMRGDRALHLSPARLLGQRIHVRETVPLGLDRTGLIERLTRLETRGHARVVVIAALARELGLRFREASLLNARTAEREADRSGVIAVQHGTKGGRGRTLARQVPVTPLARAVLARAANLQGTAANLVPRDMTYRAWRDHVYGVWGHTNDGAALKGFHDLRAAYACDRYEALTGAAAPVVAGCRSADRSADRAARGVLASELGHGRHDVVAAYVGSAR